MTDDIINTISSLALDFICLTILAGFLYSFLRYSDKSYSSFMIITLALSYVGYPIMNLYTIFCVENDQPTRIQGAIAVAIGIFNLYWTAAFALFTYMVSYSIIEAKAFNFKGFIWSTTILCLMATLIFPLLLFLDVWGDKIIFTIHGAKIIGSSLTDPSVRFSYILVRDVIGRVIPSLATSICYFKLYYLLRDSMNIVSFSRQALLRLFWYSTIPLVCSIPGIVNDIGSNNSSLYSSWIVTTVVLILRYFWEFLNLWAYWKLNPASSKERTMSSRSNSKIDSFLSTGL